MRRGTRSGAKRQNVLARDATVLRRMKSGDVDAFRTLYDLYVRDVYRYTISIVRNETDTDDVLQIVWLTFWAKRHQIEVHGETVLPWLLVTARHLSLKRVAARSRVETNLLDDYGLTAVAPQGPLPGYEGLLRYVDELVASLPAMDRAVFELCVHDDLSYAAAAEELGISTSAVRNRLHRIRLRLRVSLTNEGIS